MAKKDNLNNSRGAIISKETYVEPQELNTRELGSYTPLTGNFSSDFGSSQYDDLSLGSEYINKYKDEVRAYSQDNWDKAGNAVVRFAGRAATSAAELVGNVYGLGKYAIDLQTDPANRMEYFRKHGTLEGYKEATWTSIFDNEVTRGLDEADAWIKSKVPQYESKEYQNAPWYKKWQYANFYANDLADAAGFAVGSMVGGAAATKLTSNLFKIAKAGQLGKIDDVSEALKSGAINELQAAKEIDKIALKIKAVDYTDELTQMMFAGASESGQEARSTKDATFKKIIDDITVNPLTGKKYREATESEIRYAEMISEDASEASFLLNMAVVGPTSKLMMDSVFKGYKGLKNTVDDVDGKFNVSAKYDPKTQVYTPEVQNRYLRAVKGIGKVLGNNTTEALQEMYQTGLQAGVEDFYAAKYHGKSDYDQLLKSTNVGLEKAVSDEGLSSALLGFLTPGVSNTLLRGATGQNPLGNFSNFNKDTKKNVLYTALLNKNKASDTFKTLYESASRHQHFQNQLDNAIENADDFAAKNQMHNIIENLVYSRVQTGRLQDLYKDMEYFKSLSNEEFKEVFGVELNEEDRKTTLDFVQNKINKVNDLVKTLESVKSVFRNVSPANQARIWHATNAAKDSNERSYKLSKEVSNIVMDNYKHLNESDYRTHLSLLGLDYKSLDKTGKSNFRTLVANSEISLVDQKEIIKKLDDIDRLYKRSSNYRKLLLELNNDTVLDSLDKTDSIIGNEQDSDLTGKQSYEEHLSKKNQLLSEIEQSNDHEEILKLSKELDKNPLLEASDIEAIKTKYDSIKKVSARRKQLTNKIIAAKNKRDNILSEIFKSNYEINDLSLEQQPTSTTQSEIEAKKADIERRRQEELNVFPESQVQETVYHNTTTDFDEFKVGKDGAIHFGDKEAARQRTKNSTADEKFTKEARINIENLAEGVDSLDFDAPTNATKEEKAIYFGLLKKADNETKEHIIALYKNGKITLEQANKLIDEGWSLQKIYKELFNADGYYYINQAENKGSKSYVVFNPNQIKIVNKINAKYDEELKALEQQPTTSNQSEIEAKKADIERRRQEDLQKGQLFLMNDGTYGGSRLVSLKEYSAIQIQENNLDNDITKWDYNTFNDTGIFVNLSLGVAYIVPNNSYNGKKAEVVKVFINKTTKRFDLSNPRIINTPNIELVAKAANIDSKELYNEVLNAITKYDAELKANKVSEIVSNYKNNNNKLSKNKLFKLIDKTQSDIFKLQDYIESLESQLSELDTEIDSLETLKSSNDTIESTIADRSSKAKELDYLNNEISTTKDNISRLQKILNKLRKIFRSLFPNHAYLLEKDKHEVVEYNEELLDKAQAIKELKATLKELEEERSYVQSEINRLDAEIDEYQGLLNSIPELKFEGVDTTTDDVETVQDPKAFEFQPAKKDIIYALNSTAGNNMIGDTDKLTEDPDQLRWFKYTDSLQVSSSSDIKLVAVTKTSNIFGEDIKFFDDNDIVLVVHENGKPVKVDGKLVFTSMRLPITLEEAKEKFTNKQGLTDAQIQTLIDDITDTRELIKNSKEPMYLKVTSKTKGVPVYSKVTDVNGKIIFRFPVKGRLTKNTKNIDDINMFVATEEETVIGTQVYSTVPGMAYFIYDQQVIPARVAKLGEIDGAVDKAAELISELMDIAKPEYKGKRLYKDVKDELNLLITFGNVFGKDSNNPRQIFVTKDGRLNYGGKYYDVIDEVSLKSFLADKYIRVDKKLINTNPKIKSPLNGKTVSYKNYLLNNDGKADNQVLVGTQLVEVGTQQFKNVGLRFDFSAGPREFVKKESKITKAAVKLDKDNKVKNDAAEETKKEKIRKLFDTEEETPNAVEDTVEEETEEEEKEPVKEAPKLSKSDPNEIKERENILKELNNYSATSDIFDWDRTFTGEEIASLEDLDAEQEWFSKKFPNIPYERVKGLVQGKSVGRFLSSGKVLISDMAAKGTTYHEAFHVVSQMFLTDAELKSLYKEYRDRTGFQGTDAAVEELLAEDFRNYMLGERTSFQPKQKTIFQKIVDFLRNLLGLPKKDLDSIFSTIKSNKFKKPVRRAVEDFNRVTLDGKSVEFTQDLMDSMTVFFFKHMLNMDDSYSIESIFNMEDQNNYKDIYDKILNSFKANFANLPDSLKSKLEDNYVEIIKDWSKIVNKHIEYLEKYGIDISLDNELIAENEKTGKDNTQYIDSITFSTKDGMPKAVKLLIASLPQLQLVDGKRRPVLNYTFGLPKAVNFNKTIDFIHNTLAGSQSLEEMVKRLTDKSIERPELKTLLTYLKTNISEVTPATLSRDQFNLQMKFFQQFAKTKNTYLTTMVDDEGNIYSFDSNSSKLGDRIKTSWMNSAKKLGNNSNGFYKLVDGNIVLNKSRIQNIVNEYPLSNINNTISFLSKLGIEFSTDKFTEIEQGLLKEAALKIVKYVVDKDVKSIFQKDVVGETIKNLINIEANYTKEHVELQHINPEGKTVYGITLNTYLSLMVDSIKNTGKLEYLNVDKNPYVKNSLWRKLIAEGKKINLEVLEGLASTDKDADGVITSDLDMSSNLLQSINAILNNKFPFLRAGDKKLEYAFSIDFEMNRELFIEQMLQYYKDDISRSIALKEGKGANIQFYNNQASRSLIFEEITPIYPTITNTFKSDKQIDNFVEKNREAIVKDINNWLDKEIQNNFLAVLNDYGLISRSESKGRYDIEGIDKSTLSKIIGKENELTYDEIVRLGELFLTKSFIANVEQTKLFTGDLAFYDIAKGDFNKRTGGLTGPKKVCNTDPATNNWLKENAKRSDGKEPNGKINSIVYEDVKSTSEYYKEYAKFIGDKKAEEAYKNMKEADAQGYVTLDEYREFFLRSGEWTAKHEVAYTKAIKGEKLSKDDFQFFMPIKPQYFGPQTNDTLYVPTYYKLSLMPLIPSMIKDRKLAQLAESMKKNKVGIAMFASANKVGANLVEGGLSPFYDNAGNINDNTNIQEIDYKYLGIQLDIAPIEKTEVKFGTQFRKLILSNLFSGGKGKDITVFDGDKLVKKNTADIKKEYDLIINELTKERRKALENKLGLKIENGKYTISDYNVFKDIILDEAESRDSVDNLLSSIELAFNGDIKAVDITMHKNKIEQILYAMVNNKVISQKVFGDMKVMGSSTGFEVKTRKFKDLSTKDKSKIEWISNVDTLNFYHPTESNGTSKMQVLLPSWFKEVVGENLQSYDKRLLELIGYRIPTQGLNSIDSIEVVGFLPKEAGNLIITPSEIVGKAGSDYDVDKLNIFIPRYIMHSGKPHYLPTSTQALKKLFETIAPKNLTFEEWRNNNKQAILENRIIELSKEILSSPELFDQLINPNSVSTLTGLVSKIRDLKGTSKTKITGTKILKWYNNAQTALQFWSGKAGVGVSAIHNTSHILSQQAGLYMSAENMSIKLPCNITDNGDIDLSQEFSKDGKTRISDIINEFVNAYVDIAKDPFIFELNAGIQTSGTWFFLLRAGVPVETIAVFMRQPIIWDYIKQQSINESMLNKSLGRELNAKKFEAKIRGMYPGKVSENYEFDSSLKKLESQLTGKIDNVYQQAILTEFLKYQQGGVMLSDLMRATNADTKGAGKNRLTARYQSEMLSDLKSQGVFGNLDTYINETVLSEFIKTVDDSSKYFNDIFVTDNQFVRDTLSEIEATFKAKNYTFDTLADLMLLAENEIINYIIQTTPLNDVKLSDEIDKLFKGDNSIAKQLSSAKNNAVLKTNLLVQELFPLLANNRKNIDNIKLFNKRLNNYESNVLTEAYEQLYSMAPDLADNLTKLGILQSGLNNSPISFLSIIPANKYFEIASKTIDVRLSGENVDLSDFIDLFYQNNYQNSKIVKKISNRVLFGKYAKGSLNNKGELVVPESMSENNPFVKVVTKDKLSKAEEAEKLANGDSIYTTRLFKLVAPGEYKEVPVKGNGMYLKDYRKTDNNVVNNTKENKVFAANRGNSKFDWEIEKLKPIEAFYEIKVGNTQQKQQAQQLYSQLGNKTQSENVVIDEVNGRKPAVESNTLLGEILKPLANPKYYNDNIDIFVRDFNSKSLKEFRDLVKKGIEIGHFSYSFQEIENNPELLRQSSKPIVAYRTRGNNFLEAFEKDNAIGNPWSHLGSGQNNVKITSVNYTQNTPKENINTAYVFTENINSLGKSRVGGGSAIIRNNPNAIGIVTKKYYVYQEDRATSNIKGGWNQDFQDTNEDFELFKKVNLEQFAKLDKYNSIVFPQGFASDKAKIPTRFALWLQKELQDRYGLVTELNETKTGLISKSVENKNQYGLYKTNTVKEAVEEFIAWMIGEKHTDKLQDYRQAIIDIIPGMKGKKILYYKDIQEPSHATALDYLINKYNWNKQQPNTVEQNIKPKGTINVYWGQAESETSTRILSNLAPRKFNYESIDGITREYGSVEHAYQSNKNGKFDKATYDAYVTKGGYGVKIAPKLTEIGKRGNLQIMRDLVVESFIQNPNSEAAKKLLQYENFTHNTNELIDKAFLEGLKLAQQELLKNNNQQVEPEIKDIYSETRNRMKNKDLTDLEDASDLTFTSNENKTPINLPKSNKSGKLSVKDSFIVEDLFDTYEDKIRNKIQTRGEKFDPAKSLATMKEYAVQHGLNELKEYLKNCYN